MTRTKLRTEGLTGQKFDRHADLSAAFLGVPAVIRAGHGGSGGLRGRGLAPGKRLAGGGGGHHPDRLLFTLRMHRPHGRGFHPVWLRTVGRHGAAGGWDPSAWASHRCPR